MMAALSEPLGVVAGLRETSAAFALAIGAVILKETITTRHMAAICLAAAGAAAIALG
jgi:uncharacterized membrane protein